MHEDKSGMDNVEGFVLKWQRLANIQLEKFQVFRKGPGKRGELRRMR